MTMTLTTVQAEIVAVLQAGGWIQGGYSGGKWLKDPNGKSLATKVVTKTFVALTAAKVIRFDKTHREDNRQITRWVYAGPGEVDALNRQAADANKAREEERQAARKREDDERYDRWAHQILTAIYQPIDIDAISQLRPVLEAIYREANS